MASPIDDPRSPRPRRSFSPWSILAPIGALVLFIAFFQALGDSCLVKECKDNGTSTTEAAGPANKQPAGAKAMVKPGDTLGSIALKYNLKEAELIACNPDVDAQSLQPGDRLLVAAVDCEGQDRAATGANPDPLAGETSAVTPPANAPENNGTAAADPSANVDPAAKDTKDTAAEAGDEG
ncbi:MAG: LysM domain [Thermoleophilia bacterium]|nr:LysM domain [Thermoleophilia bacterium]